VTMIQVFEYYTNHHMKKAFESAFGCVTCLPGCFTSEFAFVYCHFLFSETGLPTNHTNFGYCTKLDSVSTLQ
jgi:hypothetical protein